VITFSVTIEGTNHHINQGMSVVDGPLLWYSGQSSWILTQRPRVRFQALPDFLSSSGSGVGSTQPGEDK
jgi:hypothetical protein